jgi:hypothetical protein
VAKRELQQMGGSDDFLGGPSPGRVALDRDGNRPVLFFDLNILHSSLLLPIKNVGEAENSRQLEHEFFLIRRKFAQGFVLGLRQGSAMEACDGGSEVKLRRAIAEWRLEATDQPIGRFMVSFLMPEAADIVH